MKKFHNYALYAPDYYHRPVWCHFTEELIEIFAGEYPIASVFEERSLESLKRASSRERGWTVGFTDGGLDCDGMTASAARNALAELKEDNPWIKGIDLFIGKKIPNAKSFVLNLKNTLQGELQRVKDEEKALRYKQYLELKKEFG